MTKIQEQLYKLWLTSLMEYYMVITNYDFANFEIKQKC